MGGAGQEHSCDHGGDPGTVRLSPVNGSPLKFEDAGTFKPETIVDASNFEHLLRAAGIDDAQMVVPGWLSAVKTAAGIDEVGRTSASRVCDALKGVGARAMAEQIRMVLGRELF